MAEVQTRADEAPFRFVIHRPQYGVIGHALRALPVVSAPPGSTER
jgi:hypothetical protein